jgi:hypothetical protein
MCLPFRRPTGTRQKTRATTGKGCPFDSEIDTCNEKECLGGNRGDEEQTEDQAENMIDGQLARQKQSMEQEQEQQGRDVDQLSGMDPDQLQTMEQSAEQQVSTNVRAHSFPA